MDRINIGSRQSEEIGSNSSQGQGIQLCIQYCSNCSETGHNVRTCQIVVEASEEEELYSSN